jgi:hypothetical protein
VSVRPIDWPSSVTTTNVSFITRTRQGVVGVPLVNDLFTSGQGRPGLLEDWVSSAKFSGWRGRVVGRNACEVKVVYDAINRLLRHAMSSSFLFSSMSSVIDESELRRLALRSRPSAFAMKAEHWV